MAERLLLALERQPGYIFPSDAGLTCVAVSLNIEKFRWLRKDIEARYAERIGEHRGLAARVAAAEALVDDAAMHQDPWSGLGIDMAGVHATFLADAIADWLHGAADERTALAGYHDTVRLAGDLRVLEGR